jgi:hypothetical protein
MANQGLLWLRPSWWPSTASMDLVNPAAADDLKTTELQFMTSAEINT